MSEIKSEIKHGVFDPNSDNNCTPLASRKPNARNSDLQVLIFSGLRGRIIRNAKIRSLTGECADSNRDAEQLVNATDSRVSRAGSNSPGLQAKASGELHTIDSSDWVLEPSLLRRHPWIRIIRIDRPTHQDLVPRDSLGSLAFHTATAIKVNNVGHQRPRAWHLHHARGYPPGHCGIWRNRQERGCEDQRSPQCRCPWRILIRGIF